jgi:predicted nucleic acid-binding Zn ribbon protein
MPRGPEKISKILADLMARRGYAGVQSAQAHDAAWRQAAGPLAAEYTRIGSLRRGKLEIIVANSTLVQELGFQKQALLEKLAGLLPDEKLKDLRFRVGRIDGT